MPHGWEGRLVGFACAPPALVARRDLCRRVESKFVIPIAATQALVASLASDYVVLPAGAARVASYRSLYFDTEDLAFFHAQRRGYRLRHKVRIRHYPDRLVSFLEIKMRVGDGLTSKARRPRAYGDDAMSADDLRFVRAHAPVGDDLGPRVRIDYSRITLLNLRCAERVTIDIDLAVSGGVLGDWIRNVAVVEVKQATLDRRSTAMATLRAARWRPGWASKYCIGVACTRPDVRLTRLREGLRAVEAVGTHA